LSINFFNQLEVLPPSADPNAVAAVPGDTPKLAPRVPKHIVSTNDIPSEYVSPLNRVTPRPPPNGFSRMSTSRQEQASAWNRKAYRWRRHRRELRRNIESGHSGDNRYERQRLYFTERSRGGCSSGPIRMPSSFQTYQSPGVDLFNEGGKIDKWAENAGSAEHVATEVEPMNY
jgi:hypothetical protein